MAPRAIGWHAGRAIASSTIGDRKNLPGRAMTENVENLILEHLKAICADQGDVRRELREVKARLVSLEGHVVQMHKSLAFVHEDIAGVNLRMDGLSERVERIERRLDLREAV